MLASLKIRDLVLIEDVTIDFAPGLNVLTGETGAGKSILLDALGLAAGARAGGRSSVRAGAQSGSAVAIFEPSRDHEARLLLEQSEIASEGEILLRRTISSDGRTRAFANDEPVGVGLLRDLGTSLVEIHGQSDDRGLFDTSTHRRMLDAFGGNLDLAANVAARFSLFEQARAERDDLTKAAILARADADYIRHAHDELSALDPQTGEEASLSTERALLMNASKIAEDISAAVDLIGGEWGGEVALAAAIKRLNRMNDEARKLAAGIRAALEQALALTEDARRELENLLSRLDRDTGTLERKEERLFALRTMARKFAIHPDGLADKLLEFKSKLDAISGDGAELKAAEVRVAQASAAYIESARKLSAARKSAAKKLDAIVAGELAPLKLGNAKFRVSLEALAEDSGAASGFERVAFEVATIVGAPFGPLTKIASGGELARFSLALKVALSGSGSEASLVFDEVDRGVGGAVADAVGERLQRLSKSTQVLLVTHAPQVAARADRHFRISRKGDRTRVDLLSEEERGEEIARMLSGASVTNEARAAAGRLLAEAVQSSKKARKRA
ncbi:MAG TPA: DNA repair protein RecN [Rhizomicrobium sp.]|jgi:DNA repair protein RecN (Recombination protein N)|nr:DNA repair protein RecN [Rhizomicrobium sp.]